MRSTRQELRELFAELDVFDGKDRALDSSRPAGSTPSDTGFWLPAAERPDVQQLLYAGLVDRVGDGIIDERARRFSTSERRLAEVLAAEGLAVAAVADDDGTGGRMPDASVDGVLTEFKSLDPGASDRTVKAALNSAKGQADYAVVDARASGLAEENARRGMRRFLGSPHAHRMRVMRILGDGYDIKWNREVIR